MVAPFGDVVLEELGSDRVKGLRLELREDRGQRRLTRVHVCPALRRNALEPGAPLLIAL